MKTIKKATSTRSVLSAKKPLAIKKTVKKRIVAKPIKAKKVVARKLSYKKTPIKRISTKKKVKLSKPFGIAVMLSGLAALVLLVVFGLPAILNPDSGKKPVLGVTVNGAPVNPAFTDPNFYACVIDNLNQGKVEGKTNRTYAHYATARELGVMQTLSCSGRKKTDAQKIKNTNGIELLSGLKSIDLQINKISDINIGNSLELEKLYLNNNILSRVDVSDNTALMYLYLGNNELTSIDLSNNTALESLGLDNNQLTSIDVSANTALKSLYLHANKLANIDVTKNTALTYLGLSGNQLASIDVTKNVALDALYLDHNNKLATIDVTKNTALRHLSLFFNYFAGTVDVTKNVALETLDLSGNQLGSIDVSKNTALKSLDLYYTQLARIDVTKNVALERLNLFGNQLTSVDVTKNVALDYLDLSGNQLTSVDVSKNTALQYLLLNKNKLNSIDITNNTVLKYLRLSDNPLTIFKAITSTLHSISSDHKSISTYSTDCVKFIAGIVPVNSLITTGIYRNGTLIQSGKLATGDVLRVSVKDNAQYFDYVINFLPTTLSFGNLTSSIDAAKGILYRRPLSFVSSVDTSQITVKGDVTITQAFMAYKDGSRIMSRYMVLVNGNKLVIQLSDGTKKEFIVKTAWSW